MELFHNLLRRIYKPPLSGKAAFVHLREFTESTSPGKICDLLKEEFLLFNSQGRDLLSELLNFAQVLHLAREPTMADCSTELIISRGGHGANLGLRPDVGCTRDVHA